MTTLGGMAGAGLADDIVTGASYNFPSKPPQVDFQGWHRPRKQFIRSQQWTYYIDTLIAELNLQGRPLSYFGLPGLDLLDIRYFVEKVCSPRNLKLRFLGFNSEAQIGTEEDTRLNLAVDEISRLDTHDHLSEVVRDDLKTLAKDTSIAWQRTLTLGPFDVINLDLCDGFGKHAPGQVSETYYDVIARLLAVQARRTTPWLLFLTTRVGPGHVHDTTITRLEDILKENLRNCASFAAVCDEKFAMANSNDIEDGKNSELGLQTVFLLGICKWLLKLGITPNLQSVVELKNVMAYTVYKLAKVPDMVSIVVKFVPQHSPIADQSKLSVLASVPLDECKLATDIATALTRMLDVDAYLAESEDILEELIVEKSAILAAAGYDVSGYREFAATS